VVHGAHDRGQPKPPSAPEGPKRFTIVRTGWPNPWPGLPPDEELLPGEQRAVERALRENGFGFGHPDRVACR